MSDYYSTRYTPDPGRTKVWRAIVEYVEAKYVGKPRAVLDLGCGYGDFVNNIHCETKYAVDLNADAKNYLNPGVKFICSTADSLSSVPDASIDLVFSSNLMEHLTDPELEATAREITRVLAPGGRFITMQPNYFYAYREYFDDYTHKKVFSHQSLSDFFTSQGFDLIAIEKKFLPFSLKSLLPKTYILTKLYLNLPFSPMAKQMLGVFGKK